ncbi:MAG: hypothetical protein H6849_04685 [Alphaproteobacteria bacterium]|nr:MAG: hypothetical protein H6849_04685 [Alphaproteobacteria bacterium]
MTGTKTTPLSATAPPANKTSKSEMRAMALRKNLLRRKKLQQALAKKTLTPPPAKATDKTASAVPQVAFPQPETHKDS